MRELWIAILLLLVFAAPARAQTFVSGRLGVDNLDFPSVGVGLESQTKTGTRFSATIDAGRARERFIGGLPSGDASVLTGKLDADWATDQRRARFFFGTGLTLQTVIADNANSAGASNLVPGISLAQSVQVPLNSDLDVRFSIETNLALAVSPETEIDLLENPLRVEFDYHLSDRMTLSPSMFVGGAFGYGGDGAKHRLGANVAFKYAFADRRQTAPAEFRPDAKTAAFVHLGWRAMGLAGHASHGPEFAAGVRFWGGWLKLGLAGFNRPGPLNPKTFSVESATGEPYKGNDRLSLKSDGGVVGILIGTQIPITNWMALDIPVIVGQAGFGFYLFGDDRETPDGRRVSAWENELQDGRDASFAIGVDAGLRAQFSFGDAPWLRPTVGVHYTATPGYAAYAKDDYGGFSASAGLEVVAF